MQARCNSGQAKPVVVVVVVTTVQLLLAIVTPVLGCRREGLRGAVQIAAYGMVGLEGLCWIRSWLPYKGLMERYLITVII